MGVLIQNVWLQKCQKVNQMLYRSRSQPSFQNREQKNGSLSWRSWPGKHAKKRENMPT